LLLKGLDQFLLILMMDEQLTVTGRVLNQATAQLELLGNFNSPIIQRPQHITEIDVPLAFDRPVTVAFGV
jgi:hypothetical protein